MLSQSILLPDKEIKWERNFAFRKQKQNAPVFWSAFTIRSRHPAEYSFHLTPNCKNLKKVICQVVCWNAVGGIRNSLPDVRVATFRLKTSRWGHRVGSLKSPGADPHLLPGLRLFLILRRRTAMFSWLH